MEIGMEKKIDLGIYNKSYDEVERGLIPSLLSFYKNPSEAYIKPFRIIGNLYYVGDRRVCAHLIDTGDGLILFDAGYQHTIHLLIQSIYCLGFNPKDIKYLILSHGHFDHFGACNELRALYGCKSYMSLADCEMLRQTPEASLIEISPNPYASLPIIDHEFSDGEIIRLGNTSIKCVLSPGHSPGTTSFFFDVADKGKTYRVGYFGGTGFLTLYKDYLNKYGLDMSLRDEFVKTIEKLKKMNVDIMLGNHPPHNHTLEKRSKMTEDPKNNPFVDPCEWNEYLDDLGEQYMAFLEKDK